MTFNFHWLWYVMIVITVVFLTLYLWFTIFPGRPLEDTYRYFTENEVGLAREYAFTERMVSILSLAAELSFLIWFTMGRAGKNLSNWCERNTGSYILSIVLFFFILWLALRLINLPFSLYNGYFLQKQWGFSTQTLLSWWMDYIKSAALDLVISGIGVILLFFAVNRWPGTWHIIAWVFISLWLVVQTFLWPILVEPLFNKFEPAKDPQIIAMVNELADKAGIPIEQVLVMDASRRTTRANAYFTGVGRVKRIVLYDTLLKDYPKDEVRAVIAHEMAHWKEGHIVKGLIMGSIGTFIVLLILYMMMKTDIPFKGHYPPYLWAYITLFFVLTSYIANPIYNYSSRRMEEEADRVSVILTEDPDSVIKLQVDLAKRNISDMSPPSFIEWFSYTHPSTMHRIEMVEKIKLPSE
ncbi:MAG: M48 family metallopeptidase [Thermoanaerobacteraceae bacterium]|nr:M48 family metallopeptidase [Thermoanaerobacteraceae bacterium]